MPLKSALDSDVRATSSYPVRRRPSATIVRTCSAGRSRTGRVIIPAWQNRQPRVQPRNTSTLSRSWTTSVRGTSCWRGIRPLGQIGDGPLLHPLGHVGEPGGDRHQPGPVVGHVVQRRDVDALDMGQRPEDLAAVVAHRPPSSPRRRR